VIVVSTGGGLWRDNPWSPNKRTTPRNSQAAGRFTLDCCGEWVLEVAVQIYTDVGSSALHKAGLRVTVAGRLDLQPRRPVRARSSPPPASNRYELTSKLIDTP
jgi:hypothetical protein